MRAVALGIARFDGVEIDCLGNQSAAYRLVKCLVFILNPVALSLDNTFEFPFGNHLAGISGEVGNCAFEHRALAAVGIYHTLFVGHFPIVIGRAAALADYAGEITALTGIELTV